MQVCPSEVREVRGNERPKAGPPLLRGSVGVQEAGQVQILRPH